MANSNGWGDGAANNAIGWGQGANNAIGWGDSHAKSWAGFTDIVGLTTDPDAQAFITAAAITDPTQQAAIDNLVVGMKADGLWTKMKAIYPFVGGTASTHKWNLKDPRDLDAAFRLVFNGGWTHSSNGATPNGTNGYADTKFVGDTNLTYGSACISFYSRTNSVGNYSDFGSYADMLNSYKSYNIQCRNVGDLARSGIYDGNTLFDWATLSVTDSRGFFVANRQSTTNNKMLRNNVAGSTNSINIAYGAKSNTYSNFIGAANNGSAIQYSNRQTAFAHIGDGLTDTEAANLYTRVQAYQTALSRNV
jgi:hypothetical protein